MFPTLVLNKDQERRLKSGHLWIYSNEINTKETPLKNFEPGDLVEVVSHHKKPIGIAYINPKTLLCARLLTDDVKTKIDSTFFTHALQCALAKREMLFGEPYYRLCFSESDFLPGLILDRFGDIIVGQINTAGIERLKPVLTEAIQQTMHPRTIVWRNDSPFRQLEGLSNTAVEVIGDDCDEGIVKENDCEFFTSFKAGQKTGWFYDHRENRQKLSRYVKDKTVLDLFSYLGAFGIPAVKYGARQVTCVDASQSAIDLLQRNVHHNHAAQKIECVQSDVFAYLKELQKNKQSFDIIILDPPAFIKKNKDMKSGMQAYESLNQLALSVLNPNGILMTASCSMHLSASDLLDCLRRGSIAEHKQISVIEQLHQGLDHPIHPAIKETNYLKGFVVTLQCATLHS